MEAGLEERLYLPHEGFNRQGRRAYSQHHVGPDGQVLDDAAWDERVGDWLPNDEDRRAVGRADGARLRVRRVTSWIAAAKTGINDQPVEFDYVHLAEEGVA